MSLFSDKLDWLHAHAEEHAEFQYAWAAYLEDHTAQTFGGVCEAIASLVSPDWKNPVDGAFRSHDGLALVIGAFFHAALAQAFLGSNGWFRARAYETDETRDDWLRVRDILRRAGVPHAVTAS